MGCWPPKSAADRRARRIPARFMASSWLAISLVVFSMAAAGKALMMTQGNSQSSELSSQPR